MNQILSTNNNSNNNKNTINIKSVIVIFCVAIILFGVIVGGKSAYDFYTKRYRDSELDKLNKPEIILEQYSNEEIKIIAKYDQGLSKLSYIWNDTNRTDSNLDGKTSIEKLIQIPENTINILKVIAVGNDGREEAITREFVTEGDAEKPEIHLEGDSKLYISATDETELDFLTYKWADEEAVTVLPEEDITTINVEIEIKRGINELVIEAVDKGGNKATVKKTFKGVKEPEISWIKNDNEVEMEITHDMGFQKIIFIVNNQEYTYDSNYSGYSAEKTNVKFKTQLKEGENSIIIKAYSNEGSEKIKEGIATYIP